MSFKVPVTTIREILPHPNPETTSLELAKVYGWIVVVRKSTYKVGDTVVYVPVDSVLSEELEAKLFPEGSKVKLHGRRIRTIKLRKHISQGMLVGLEDVKNLLGKYELEDDVAEKIGITKYEPPFVGTAFTPSSKGNRNKRTDHPDFHHYNGLENVKWFPDKFKDGDDIVISEKLHGSNSRSSLLPFIASTWRQKLLKFLRLAPKVYKAYGSNNVEISAEFNYTGYYGEDVYGKVFKKIDVFNKLKLGETVFGEIVGPGIQKGYEYSLKEHKFVLFDVKVLNSDGNHEWLNPDQVEQFAKDRGFDMVPVLYKGPYNKELAYSLTKGPSVFDPNTKVREGIVIKAAKNYSISGNKQALKWLNEDYLLDYTNTDNH